MLIWRRRVVGYQIAVPLMFLETLLAPMIAAQTVSQLSAGISLTPGEIVGPLAGFIILAGAAGWSCSPCCVLYRASRTRWTAATRIDSRN